MGRVLIGVDRDLARGAFYMALRINRPARGRVALHRALAFFSSGPLCTVRLRNANRGPVNLQFAALQEGGFKISGLATLAGAHY